MPILFRMFVFFGITLSLPLVVGLSGLSGCGSVPVGGQVNEHFLDVSETPTEPTASIDKLNTDQVTVVEPDIENKGAKIGTIADIDPAHVLCVVIDPADGDLADLEVCAADKINTETQSAEALCPEADQPSRCASLNGGSGPDFCEVTGSTDYAFVLLNLSAKESTIAYQVIDVSGYPNRSCEDLNITESSIAADE